MKLTQTFAVLLVATLALAMTSCGCTDDTVVAAPGDEPRGEQSQFDLLQDYPPCPVDPTGGPVRRIDVFFLIDDSLTMTGLNPLDYPAAGFDVPLVPGQRMGLIPFNLQDDRIKSVVARQVFAQVRATILTKVTEQYPGESFDFAFGVGRYEDFGGDFASGRSVLTDADGTPLPNSPISSDTIARPFILNMPILRAADSGFNDAFVSALGRTAPGDGNQNKDEDFNPADPYVTTLGGDPITEVELQQQVTARVRADAQTGVEALFQIATGDGLDGNGDDDTFDSGEPCGTNTQTDPGTSGDVPETVWETELEQAVSGLVDSTGCPLYRAKASDGTPLDSCRASGNLGGVGWRDAAARFVIVAGDIASVAPFLVTPPDPSADAAQLRNDSTEEDCEALGIPTDITPDTAPGSHDGRNVWPNTFDDSLGGLSEDVRNENGLTPRYGGAAGVAPDEAATVQQALDALDCMKIEVLCIGAAFVGVNSGKPIPGRANATIPDPSKLAILGAENSQITPAVTLSNPPGPGDPVPTITPYTWMSSTSWLSGASLNKPVGGGQQRELPLTYNLDNLGQWNTDFPNDTLVTDELVDDLTQRIRAWVDGEHLDEVESCGGGGEANKDPNLLPQLFIDVTLFLDDGDSNPDFDPDTGAFVRTSVSSFLPGQSGSTQAGSSQGGASVTRTIEVPVYWSDESAPPNARSGFRARHDLRELDELFPGDGDETNIECTEDPFQGMVPFRIRVSVPGSGVVGGGADQRAQLFASLGLTGPDDEVVYEMAGAGSILLMLEICRVPEGTPSSQVPFSSEPENEQQGSFSGCAVMIPFDFLELNSFVARPPEDVGSVCPWDLHNPPEEEEESSDDS